MYFNFTVLNVFGNKVMKTDTYSGTTQINQSCLACYSAFIEMNAKPSRIAFTTQRFDTPVY